MIYSLFGWLIENVYSLITTRVFFKPNLFIGPFKPMYGIAPVLLILMINETTSWLITLLLCFVIPTLVEYISGLMLYKLYGRRWWDYTHLPFQIQGHICLPFSLSWVILSLLCLKVIHPYVNATYESIESYWIWIWPSIVFYFLMEMLISFRRHRILIPTS